MLTPVGEILAKWGSVPSGVPGLIMTPSMLVVWVRLLAGASVMMRVKDIRRIDSRCDGMVLSVMMSLLTCFV